MYQLWSVKLIRKISFENRNLAILVEEIGWMVAIESHITVFNISNEAIYSIYEP
jgi:hypothetical protein